HRCQVAGGAVRRAARALTTNNQGPRGGMMRGRWLVPALMLALAACGGDRPQPAGQGAAAPAEQSFRWKMVTTWPKNYPGLGTAPEKFAELIARMSNGRLTVKVFGAGQLVPAMEVFDTVSSGTA